MMLDCTLKVSFLGVLGGMVVSGMVGSGFVGYIFRGMRKQNKGRGALPARDSG